MILDNTFCITLNWHNIKVEVLCIMFISNFYKHIHGKYETRIFIAYITALSIMCVCVCARMHVYVCALGCIQFFVTPMECRAPGSSVHRIFQARYWSGLPFSASRDLPFLTQGLNQCLLCLLHWQTDSLPLHHLVSIINRDRY